MIFLYSINLAIGVDKVYQYCTQNYYSITWKDVNWVLNQCAQCKLSAQSQGKPPIKPIVSKYCLEHITIDLMDFRGNPDGEYKWILQIKDHFSRFVWLFAMKDKASATVERILREWFNFNGIPIKWYVACLIPL